MGFKLRREVRDLLPPGLLTATERCVVLELADSCADDDDLRVHAKPREGWPGVEWIARAADVSSEKKAGELLASIGRKWFELRVPLGTGKNGRPFYSTSGTRTTYRFPSTAAMSARAEALGMKVPCSGGPSELDANERSPETGELRSPETRDLRSPNLGDLRSPETGDPSPQGSSSKNSSKNNLTPSPSVPSPAAAAPAVALTPEEGEEIESSSNSEEQTLVATIRGIRPGWTKKKIKDAIEAAKADERPWPLIAAAFPICAADTATMSPGRLPHDGPWWAEAEAKTRPASREERIAAHSQWSRTQPPCEHGVEGGDIPLAGDGWQPCSMCRAKTAEAKRAAEPTSIGTRCADQARNAAAELSADLAAGRMRGPFGRMFSVPTGPTERMSPGDRAFVRGAGFHAKYAALEAEGHDPDDVLEGIVIDDEGDAA